MNASVHGLRKQTSARVLGDSRAGLPDTTRHGLHLNNEARDDDANILPASFLVGVEREAGAPAAQQFDACNSVDINILHRHRLDDRGCEFQHCQGFLPVAGVVSYATRGDYKAGALQFSRLSQIARVPFALIRELDAPLHQTNFKGLVLFRNSFSEFWFRFLPRGFASTQTTLGSNAVRQLAVSRIALPLFIHESRGGVDGHATETHEERERTQRPHTAVSAQIKNDGVFRYVLGAGTRRRLSGATVQEPSVDCAFGNQGMAEIATPSRCRTLPARFSLSIYFKKNPPRALRDWFPAVLRVARLPFHESFSHGASFTCGQILPESGQ